MWASYATGALALSLLLLAWLAVQRGWQRICAEADDDPDALAGRMGCAAACAREPCSHPCPRRETAGPEEKP